MSKLDLTNLTTGGITPSYVSVDIAAARWASATGPFADGSPPAHCPPASCRAMGCVLPSQTSRNSASRCVRIAVGHTSVAAAASPTRPQEYPRSAPLHRQQNLPDQSRFRFRNCGRCDLGGDPPGDRRECLVTGP